MKRPAIMGIVNVTPDSFSGDGVLADAAISHAHRLVQDGADILDIGAESTRPGASALNAADEWARLQSVLTGIVAQRWRSQVRLSVDTRHAQTAMHALELGVDMINDVSGLNDPAMLDALAPHTCDIVVMHALSIPADRAVTLPPNCDVVAEILAWKHALISRAAALGIARERLIYDAGIGFGKTAPQSLALMLSAQALHQSGGRWLMGHSRKSFLTMFDAASADQRDALTLAFSAQLAYANMDYVRVHAVAAHRLLFDTICT
jgi:dihydropteroate synthase